MSSQEQTIYESNQIANLLKKYAFNSLEITQFADIIFIRPKVNINLPSKWHDWIIAEDSRPSFTVLRIDYK